MDKIISFIDFKYLNTFALVSVVKSFFSSLEFSFSLFLFLLIISIFSFLV
jgi:hypothetical protein